MRFDYFDVPPMYGYEDENGNYVPCEGRPKKMLRFNFTEKVGDKVICQDALIDKSKDINFILDCIKACLDNIEKKRSELETS